MTTFTKLPEARIEDVIVCQSDLDGCQLHEIWYRDQDGMNVVLAYSQRPVPPEVGGTLLREQGPKGLTMMWVDVGNERAGLGYDEDGLPESWGKPTPPSIGMTEKQIRAFGGDP